MLYSGPNCASNSSPNRRKKTETGRIKTVPTNGIASSIKPMQQVAIPAARIAAPAITEKTMVKIIYLKKVKRLLLSSARKTFHASSDLRFCQYITGMTNSRKKKLTSQMNSVSTTESRTLHARMISVVSSGHINVFRARQDFSHGRMVKSSKVSEKATIAAVINPMSTIHRNAELAGVLNLFHGVTISVRS